MKWDVRRAMKNLGINMVPFNPDRPTIDCRGYSEEHNVAIRPGERHPVFVAIHEMAHIILGHTYPRHGGAVTFADVLEARMELPLRETQAHTVAIMVAGAIGLDECDWDFLKEVDYLGHFLTLTGREVTDEEIEQTMIAARKIMRAGRE